MRVIKHGKVYITRGGHLYRVVALTREAVTFESRGGWKETWPIDRFMAAVEPEPLASTRVEPQPAPVPTNPNLFSAQGKAAGLLESYGEIAWEIESLAVLAGGTDPDDDLCDALAQLACAMKSLAAAREKALAEWAADGCAEPEPGCGYFATGVPISVGAPPEPAGPERADPAALIRAIAQHRAAAVRVYGPLGYEKIDRATGAVPGERRLDPETFQEVEEAVDRALRHVEPEEKP